VQFMAHHQGKEPPFPPRAPLQSSEVADYYKDPFDVQFANSLSEDMPFYYQVITDANYLGVESIVMLLSVKIAAMIRGRSLSEVNRILQTDSHRKREKGKQKESSSSASTKEEEKDDEEEEPFEEDGDGEEEEDEGGDEDDEEGGRDGGQPPEKKSRVEAA
jgi:hypothetical protein